MERRITVYRILIVEDEEGIAQAVKEQAELWGLEAECVRDFRNVMTAFAEYAPHLVLMDIGLPFFNGYHWCGEIRKISSVPVMFISSASDSMNIVMAMNMGADDFIVKPFDGSVLIAKIQALLRRTYDFAGSVPVMEHRGALLNLGDNTLVYQRERINLSKNEYRILLALMENKGKVVSRERLMDALWEMDCYVEGFITTKVGVGYIITVDQELHRP